jgi:sugar phosphate isomerase/epimerase
MTLGLFARTFARPSVEEVFAAAAQHGARCLQFNFACAGLPSLPDQLAASLLERIRQAARQQGLALAAVSGTFNMIHPEAAQRETGLRRLEVVTAACAALGVRVVTLCTGTRDPHDMWKHHVDNATPQAWHDLLQSLTRALAMAEKHDLVLGVEPEIANVIRSARLARHLLDELRTARLKIVLDAANLFQPHSLSRQREILDEAFELLGHDLVLVHGKELGSDGWASDRSLGTGVLDWQHYFHLLRQAAFHGPMILHGFVEADAAASVRFVRQFIEADPEQG